jgi:hypothetical protein
MRNIRQNLFFAFAYNALGIPLAVGLLYPFFGILLSRVIAGAAMSLSSVSVCHSRAQHFHSTPAYTFSDSAAHLRAHFLKAKILAGRGLSRWSAGTSNTFTTGALPYNRQPNVARGHCSI